MTGWAPRHGPALEAPSLAATIPNVTRKTDASTRDTHETAKPEQAPGRPGGVVSQRSPSQADTVQPLEPTPRSSADECATCVCHRHTHTPWTKLRARAAVNTLLLGATLIEGTGAEPSKGAATQTSCGIHPCLRGPSEQDGRRATAGHQGCHPGARCGPQCPQTWPLGPPHAPHGPGPATGCAGTCRQWACIF